MDLAGRQCTQPHAARRQNGLLAEDRARTQDAAGPGPLLKRVLWYWVSLTVLETGLPWPMGIKRFWLRVFGAKLGKGVVLKPRIRVKYPWNLTIGDHSWIGEEVWIDNLDHVHIGHHCCVSQGAYLLCGNHDYTRPTFDLITRSVILEDGSWAGARADRALPRLARFARQPAQPLCRDSLGAVCACSQGRLSLIHI